MVGREERHRLLPLVTLPEFICPFKETYFSIFFFPIKAETCGFLLWVAPQRNTELGSQSSNTWQICTEMRYVWGLNIWSVTTETSPGVFWALCQCQGGSTDYSKESGQVFLLGLLREQGTGPSHRHSPLVVYPESCEGNSSLFSLGTGRPVVPKKTPAESLNSFLGWFPASRSAPRWPSKGAILYLNSSHQKIPSSSPNMWYLVFLKAFVTCS